MLSSRSTNKEIKRPNMCALRVLNDDYDASFEPLEKDGSSTVHEKTLQNLMTEIYKRANQTNPPYSWRLFLEKDEIKRAGTLTK